MVAWLRFAPPRRHAARRHCEPTGRANARPMTGSAKQSICRKESVDCFVASLLAMTTKHTSAISQHDLPELCYLVAPLLEERAQGMPGARCTRGLVCQKLRIWRTRAYR